MSSGRLRIRLFWAGAALVAVLGLYAWLGGSVLPAVLRVRAAAYAREHYGLELRLSSLQIEPFALRMRARGLTLSERGGGPLFAASSIEVDLRALASLWRRAYVFSQVTLEQPALHVVQEHNGKVNLQRFNDRSNERATSTTAAVWIESLSVHDAKLAFAGCTHQPCFRRSIDPLSLTIKDLRTDGGHGDLSLTARTSDGTQVQWRAQLTLRPALESRGTLTISALPLRTLFEYASDELPIAGLDGELSFSGSYGLSLRPGAHSELALTGLSVRNLRVRPQTGAALLADRIQLTDIRVAPRERTIVVGRIALLGPRAQVARDAQGRLDLTFGNGTSRSTGQTDEASPWQVQVHALQVEDGRLDLEQRTAHGAVKRALTDVELSLRGLSSDPHARVETSLHLEVEEGGRVTAEGVVTPSPLSTEIDLSVEGLELAPLQGLVEQLAHVELRSGSLGLQGRLRVAEGKGGVAPSFLGDVALNTLRLTEHGTEQDLVRADQIALEGVRLESELLDIQRVRLERPYARLVLRPDSTLNFTHLRNRPSSTQPALDSQASAYPDQGGVARVGELSLKGMRMDFADVLIRPHFALPIQDLSGTIRGLTTEPGHAASVKLHGSIGQSSPVSITGELRPLAPREQADIRLRAENISLPVFNPYSGRFAGYAIERGELSTNIHYRVVDERLQAEHAIRVDQLAWGDATKQKPKAPLPVKLATALLRDRHGVIRLDVPLHGTLDDPSFRVWPVVWQAIKNVMIKAASAPFDALGKWFQGAEKAQYLEFAAGDSTLNERSRAALSALKEALVEREGLTLEVPTKTIALDRAGIADRKLQQQIADKLAHRRRRKSSTYAQLKVDDQIELLQRLYEERTGKEAAVPRRSHSVKNDERTPKASERSYLERALREVTPVADEELASLGRERAEAVERSLTGDGRLAASRVLLSQSGTVSAQGEHVRLKLELR